MTHTLDHLLDPRVNAFREDLADTTLKESIEAPRYVDGTPAQICTPSAPLRRAPRFDAPLETEALFGAQITVFDEAEGWAWVQLTNDNYVGYLPSNCLSREITLPTHRVSALRTFIYPAPDIKTPPTMALSLMSSIQATAQQKKFLELSTGGFIYAPHTDPIDATETDFVMIAQWFIGSPYLWGGRQNIGIDCSGLVQISMETTGRQVPRDTDMQALSLGEQLTDITSLQRGDLVFWDGHVGIMVDPLHLLHANAHHMMTIIEPLEQAQTRIAGEGKEISCIKRLQS